MSQRAAGVLPVKHQSPPRIIQEFWGDADALTTITNVGAVKTFDAGTQVTPSLPPGSVIDRAVLLMRVRRISEDSTAPNAVNGATAVQIELVVAGAWANAITIPDNLWALPGNGDQSGDFVLVGDIDVKAQVASGAASEFRINAIASDGPSLYLYDVQFGIQIHYR